MAILSGTAELQCEHCENIILIDASDLYIDQVGSDERQMGPEILYAGAADLNCPQCGGYINVKYDASEYPIGVPNYSEMQIEGARTIRGFVDIDFSLQEKIYSFEEESRLYLPEEDKIITDLSLGVTELIVEISKIPSLLYQISPRKFEELIAHIFSQHGFKVELTKRTRDGGRDIIAIKSDEMGIKLKLLVECKRYAANKPVSVGLVRALYGVQMQEGANKSVLATTSRFTSAAHSFAKTKNTTEWLMDLKDFNDIHQWIISAAASN